MPVGCTAELYVWDGMRWDEMGLEKVWVMVMFTKKYLLSDMA